MDTVKEKCVIIVDEDTPAGIAANTAAILGITLGVRMPDIVGEDNVDQEGNTHLGITRFPIPVLRTDAETLANIREKLYLPDYTDLTVVDFSEQAQKSRDYADYTEQLSASHGKDLNYLGVAVCGNKKKVNKLTGNLPLLK